MKREKRSFCELPSVITGEGKRVTGKIDWLVELDDGSWAAIDYQSEAATGGRGMQRWRRSTESRWKFTARWGSNWWPGKNMAGFLYFVETGKFPVAGRIFQISPCTK